MIQQRALLPNSEGKRVLPWGDSDVWTGPAAAAKVSRPMSSAQAISLLTTDRYTKCWLDGSSRSKSVIKSRCTWPFGCDFSIAQLSLEDDSMFLILKGAEDSGANSILGSGLGVLKPPRGTPEFHTWGENHQNKYWRAWSYWKSLRWTKRNHKRCERKMINLFELWEKSFEIPQAQ